MLNTIYRFSQHSLYQLFTLKIITCFVLIPILYGCSGVKSISSQSPHTQFKDPSYEQQFTGVLIVAPQKKDTLFAMNENKYFTPASTVKIFTLYTGLQLLSDRIPTLKYQKIRDTLYAMGTGDPTWLHPYFQDSTGISFLNTHKNVSLYLDNFLDDTFAPGWAWEDYAYYFSPERGSLPLYGNVATFIQKGNLEATPKLFQATVERRKSRFNRALEENLFYIPKILKDTLTVPYKTSDQTTKDLLTERIDGNLKLVSDFPAGDIQTLYGVPTDSIYKRMLLESDNFLAEQLMLTASSVLTDSLSFIKSRDYMLDRYLTDLVQRPRWVDGSGLSRYNLFTPLSLVQVLDKIYHTVPKERLFHLFPSWNASGTLKRTSNTNDPNFIHAKSGSMGNTYNLCGYLETKRGEILIFSFMNNHFRHPTQTVKNNMFTFLKKIHEEN